MPESRTLLPLIDSLAEHGDQPALVAFTKDDLRQWSYRRLHSRICRAANELERRGLQEEDRAVLLAPNSPAWIAGCLAIIKRRAVASPIDVQFSDDVLEGVLEDCQPRLILTTEQQAKRLDELDLKDPPERVLLDEVVPDDSDDDESEPTDVSGDSSDDLDPQRTAVLFYTSGTTGPPKGVPLSHQSLAFELDALREADIVRQDDRALLPLPLHHVYPFVIGMLTPMAMGMPIILPHSLVGPQITRAIKQGEATVVVGVPRLYRALVAGIEAKAQSKGRVAAAGYRASLGASRTLRRALHLRSGKWLLRPLHREFGQQLRMAASGGSPLDPALARKLEAFGWQVAIGYGLTETSPLVTLNRPGQGKLDSVGQPLSGVEIRLDPSARPEADGEESQSQDEEEPEEGEILVRGPNVFSGYRNLPDKTKEAFTEDGWYRTGDLGSMDEDGYLYVHGRASTMIVTEGGENVQPDQVEDAFAEHPVIREIGVLDQEGKLAALIVPDMQTIRQQDGAGSIEQSVRWAVEERGKKLPSYQRLADFAVTRDPLPRTRLGKIQRHKLEERFEKAKTKDSDADEEQGPVSLDEMSSEDRALLQDSTARNVWEVLTEKYSDQRLSPDTSPQLDLGIDSMEWLNLSLEISRRAEVELDEEAIARVETVRDLLQEAVGQAGGEGGVSFEEISENPLAHLNEEQERHLSPLGSARSMLSRQMFFTNRQVMKAVFGLEVRGREHVPDEGPFVLAPNHTSALDPPALAASLDWETLQRTFWGGWRGLMFSNPVARGFSRLGHVMPIDPHRGVKSSMAFGLAALERGWNLVWFPEGERSPEGKLLPFKPGIGILLQQRDIPVLPVLIEGTYEVMPLGNKIPRPHKITVTFGEPQRSEDLQERGDGDEAHQRIASALQHEVAQLANRRSESLSEAK